MREDYNDHTLGMEKYDMKQYWDKRARYFNEGEYKAVCMLGAPKPLNEYLDRIQKDLFSKLLIKIGDLRNKKVLEIGCGTGRWAKYLIEKEHTIKYVGVDIAPTMIEIAKRRVPQATFLNIPAQRLIFHDESFDLTFSITALQHMPYREQYKAIKEMCRVTKRGGNIIIIEDIWHSPEAFNMFSHPINEWVKIFENFGCKALYIRKHKLKLSMYIIRKISKVPIMNKTPIWLGIILEHLSPHILPEKYFYGVGILFQKL